MARAIYKLSYWLFVAFLAFIGVSGGPSGLLKDQSWQGAALSWVMTYGLPAAALALAVTLATLPAFKWVLDRRHTHDLQRQVRQNLAPGSFQETDAAEALQYLLHESVWGWKTYSRLNFWTTVDGLHRGEFERAALAGEIAVFGYGSREGKVARIERRFWKAFRLDPATLEARMPRSAAYLEKPTYSELSVPTVELALVWPKASLARRLWARFWVLLKTRVWYGSRLNNWMDQRRRRSKLAPKID